jgi:type VI secretion system protein ImpA
MSPADPLFAGLLEPVPGALPAGEALRWGAVHAAIEEARRDEDADLPQGVWRRDVKRADWEAVVRLCREALAERSKDLQVASWLVDGAVRLHGPAVGAAALDFLGTLAEAWWDDLYPPHDGDPDSPRFAPLVWLDGAMAQWLAAYPIARAETGDGIAGLSWSDHAAACRRDAAGRSTKPAKAGHAWPTVAGFDALADRTDREHLVMLAEACPAVEAAAIAFEERLATLAGDEAPRLARLRGVTRDVGALLHTILARRPPRPPTAPPTPPFAPFAPFAATIAKVTAAMSTKSEPSATAALADREQAYHALADIAAFLRRVEPHSPTPFLIERAIRWGGMALPQVLADAQRRGGDGDILKWLMDGADK